jgi:hypothetical protein
MAEAGGKRGHDVQAFAAGYFGPACEALILKQVAQNESCFSHKVPDDIRPGIKIEGKLIGLLDIVHGRIPRMQLGDPDSAACGVGLGRRDKEGGKRNR